ncbi:MAG: hypothetical protein HY364_00740 [Candidatus Aenigmarchaeota archaeon]|nr:hypothetical protein [Candidatus Aenigmarchaeota archaeon]
MRFSITEASKSNGILWLWWLCLNTFRKLSIRVLNVPLGHGEIIIPNMMDMQLLMDIYNVSPSSRRGLDSGELSALRVISNAPKTSNVFYGIEIGPFGGQTRPYTAHFADLQPHDKPLTMRELVGLFYGLYGVAPSNDVIDSIVRIQDLVDQDRANPPFFRKGLTPHEYADSLIVDGRTCIQRPIIQMTGADRIDYAGGDKSRIKLPPSGWVGEFDETGLPYKTFRNRRDAEQALGNHAPYFDGNFRKNGANVLVRAYNMKRKAPFTITAVPLNQRDPEIGVRKTALYIAPSAVNAV